MTIRVVLADDHRMFREALRIPLAAEQDMDIVGETANGAETLATVEKLAPDVLVLDIALPDMSGVEVATQIRLSGSAVRIVALSGYDDRFYVDEMFKRGASAYVIKSSGADELIRAIRSVSHGESFVSPELAGQMIQNDIGGAGNQAPPPSVLSRREREVLALLAAGRRSAAIAQELGIAPATVDVYRRNIRQKLGVQSTAELTRYAMRFDIGVVR